MPEAYEKFWCDVCEKGFPNKVLYGSHLSRTHGGLFQNHVQFAKEKGIPKRLSVISESEPNANDSQLLARSDSMTSEAHNVIENQDGQQVQGSPFNLSQAFQSNTYSLSASPDDTAVVPVSQTIILVNSSRPLFSKC